MNEFEILGFFDFEDFVSELSDEQLIAVNGGSCGSGCGGGASGGGVTTSSNSISISTCGGGTVYATGYYGTCAGGTVTSATTYSSGVGTCGGASVPSYQTCGGGYSSSQGSFGYLTNSAVNNTKMQDYENTADDAKMNGEGNLFSKVGCKMMAFAKILSQATGNLFTLMDINENYDQGKDGLIGMDEVGDALQKNLKNKKVTVDYWEKGLSKERLDKISGDSGTTYILGKAKDVAGGDHWIVLEGYSTNSYGQVEFTYNGTSKNDVGRKFILGEPTAAQKKNNYYQITKIETYNIS